MANILTPGYLRWDGSKYVLDSDIEIIGPLGPDGPPGPAGGVGPAGPAGPAGAVATVTATLPISSTGGTNPVISIAAATTIAAGSMSAADKTKLDSISGGTVLSVAGTAPIVSTGGATPAISINAATTGAAGSLSAADKTKLDSLTSGAAIASVTGSGNISVTVGANPVVSITNSPAFTTSVTTPIIQTSSGNLTINSFTGIEVHQKNASTSRTDTLDPAGANTIVYPAGITSLTESITQHGSSTGVTWRIQGQQGASGFVGGIFKIGGGAGGTSGTNLAGDTQIDLGTPVSGTSAKASYLVSGTSVFDITQSAGNIQLNAIGKNIAIQSTGATASGISILVGSNGGTLSMSGDTITTYRADTTTVKVESYTHSGSITATESYDAGVIAVIRNQSPTLGPTAASYTIQAQSSSNLSGVGGKLSLKSGNGNTGGGLIEIVGADSGAGNGPGGNVSIRGGALSGTGFFDGNIALHSTSPNFNSGGRIMHVLNATAEPTAAPANGSYLWMRSSLGQLTTRMVNGDINEISSRWSNKSAAAGPTILRRSDNFAWATASSQTVLQIPAADLPGVAAGNNWITRAVATYLCWDITDTGWFKDSKEVIVTCIGGVVALQAINSLGAPYDGTSVNFNAGGCVASVDGSKNINFTVNNIKGKSVNCYVQAELSFFSI